MANTTPRSVSFGISDRSTQPRASISPDLVDDSTPLIMAYAEQGTFAPTYINGDNAKAIFGAATFDENSPYGTPVTRLLNTHLANGSDVLFIRAPMDNCQPGMIRLGVQLVPDKFPVANSATPISGYQLIWRALPSSTLLSNHPNPESATDNLSYCPQYNAYYFGQSNDYIDGIPIATGYSQESPFDLLFFPILTITTSETSIFANRLSALIRSTPVTAVTGQQLKTQGAVALEVGFKLDSKVFRTELGDTRVLLNPAAKSVTGELINKSLITQVNNAFGELVAECQFHDDSLDSLHTVLLTGKCTVYPFQNDFNGETYYQQQAGLFADNLIPRADDNNRFLLDIFTGMQVGNGEPLYTVSVARNRLFSGYTFSDLSEIPFTGASGYVPTLASGTVDRNMAWAKLDLSMREFADSFMNNPYHLVNMAAWPFGHIYDMGFSMDTKASLAKMVGYRKDVMVYLTPFSYMEVEYIVDDGQPGGGGTDTWPQPPNTTISCANATDHLNISPDLYYGPGYDGSVDWKIEIDGVIQNVIFSADSDPAVWIEEYLNAGHIPGLTAQLISDEPNSLVIRLDEGYTDIRVRLIPSKPLASNTVMSFSENPSVSVDANGVISFCLADTAPPDDPGEDGESPPIPDPNASPLYFSTLINQPFSIPS